MGHTLALGRCLGWLQRPERRGGEDPGPYVVAALNGDVDNHADLRVEHGLRIHGQITTDAKVIPALEALIGNTIAHMIADAGYRGHNAPPEHKLRVFTAGQKRRMTPQIKHEMKRRAAVEPVIGHLKEDHRMGRNYLAHRAGDAANAVLAATGYNFRRLIRWLRLLLFKILTALFARLQLNPA